MQRPHSWLRKLSSLPPDERRLLLEAMVWLVVVRIGLWTLPFMAVRRALAGVGRRPVSPRGSCWFSESKLVWAVETAGRLAPWARTCLTQALTVQLLMSRRKLHSLLHIGVVKGEGEQLEAHAWVESAGEVIIGGFELERYVPLMVLTADNSAPIRPHGG